MKTTITNEIVRLIGKHCGETPSKAWSDGYNCKIDEFTKRAPELTDTVVNMIVEEIENSNTVSMTPETKMMEIESYKLGAKSFKQQIIKRLTNQ